MAAEQEVDAMRGRLASLEAAESDRSRRAAVAQELSRHPIASPAAMEQLTDLILPAIQITKVSDGRELAHGPDYKPLGALVSETLQRADYAHFLKPNGSGTPAPAQPAVPAPQSAAANAGGLSAVREILDGENFGAAIVRAAKAEQTAKGDPRLDPSQPFGLGRSVAPR